MSNYYDWSWRALYNFDGDFIGMNFYAAKETPFLPRNKILQLLKQFSERIPSWAKKGPCSTIKRFPIPHKSDSQGSSKVGDKNKDQKPSICTLCDPECQPGLEDEILSCVCFHARWPYSSPHGDAEKKAEVQWLSFSTLGGLRQAFA